MRPDDNHTDDEINGAANGPDEVLVAYLDGQLSAEECERVESMLASDAATRQRLQSLDRVWNALDVLPRSTASPTFTRSTIEMAAVTAASLAKEPRGVDEPRRLLKTPRVRIPVWVVASLIGVAGGAMLTLAAVTAPERRAMADLPVALHAAALEQVGSLEFLTKLDAGDNKGLEEFRDESVESAAASWATVTAASTPERRQWVETLSPAELTSVNARVAEYQSRPAGKQASLRQFNDALAAAPDAVELRETALAYEAMVGRLPASEQARLRQLTTDERLRVVDREARRWAHDAKLDLTGAEVAAFRDAIDRLTESESYRKVGDQFVAALREGFAARRGEGRDDDRNDGRDDGRGDDRRGGRGEGRGDERFERGMREIEQGMTEFFKRQPKVLLFGATDRIAGRGMRRGRFDRLPGGEKLQDLVRDSWRGWVTELEKSLPADAAASLQSAEDDKELARRLNHLIGQTFVKDDLPTAFARLDSTTMDRMLLAPTDEFRDALSTPEMGGGPFPREFDLRGGPPFDGPRDGEGPRRGRDFGPDFGRGGPPRGFGPLPSAP
ncbi:hypothetical protein [Botrimarina mediterranea]|uniref:Zinc-finger domain-containing protein n=1 Tax=Botrimarina mediterranea TaxID=2528022 RepID=A0A518KEI8_9BACT|nr:hypothetical protein [Botrimarina mediterranea]QDV76189.1 hypothetical protein Spa11_44140 [Botrimarina mediterranea]